MEHPYQERVLEEREELAAKLLALHAYIITEGFFLLDEPNKELLTQQVSLMAQYLNVLDVRISLF